MLKTIRHESKGDIVKVAQYLTGYARIKEASGEFDAHFVSHVTAWQRTNKLTPDGIIGQNTWAMIVKKAPMCSTSKNKTSAATCALQILLDGPVPEVARTVAMPAQRADLPTPPLPEMKLITSPKSHTPHTNLKTIIKQ